MRYNNDDNNGVGGEDLMANANSKEQKRKNEKEKIDS
jgi:hypothetical protein